MLKVFGKYPKGGRRKALEASPNFREGKFHNLEETPNFTEGGNIFKILREYWKAPKSAQPDTTIITQKNALDQLSDQKMEFIWFGHSSYLINAYGYKILVDPVLSGNAGPFRFNAKAFPGSDSYNPEDVTDINLLVITHDHYDHLDYKTIREIHPRVKKIVTGLGTGSHLQYWNVDPQKILEFDWWDEHNIDGNTLTYFPTRHFSGRDHRQNRTLWGGFSMEINGLKLYLGGDSGQGKHFKTIGDKLGPFDFGFMECGQYGKYWKNIHTFPEEIMQAADQLGVKKIIPVHWGKFRLANHDWMEPVNELKKAIEDSNRLLIPVHGAIKLLK